MPLPLETTGRSSFTQYASICDQEFPEEDSDSDSCVSSSSSLGRNSDSSEEEDSSDREDSGVKGPLDSIKDLEDDLPVKKGISKFYIGKSKSFTSLADAAGAACVQEIVKPEDPYAKKRKNLLARNLLIGRSRSYADNVGGISKRNSNINRRTSCLNLNSNNTDSGDEGKSSTSISPPRLLPPRHPQANRLSANSALPRPTAQSAPLRSYSWSDLHSVAEGNDIPGLAICSGNKDNKVH